RRQAALELVADRIAASQCCLNAAIDVLRGEGLECDRETADGLTRISGNLYNLAEAIRKEARR
ncbi:MAG: hypothetical protein AAGL98_08330, partial [Planctomycetota bacterium]